VLAGFGVSPCVHPAEPEPFVRSYGATFFALTGLHGIHVMIGTTILIFILARALRGQFTPEHHFAFTAASWYWHFVGVLWLILFVLVYCL